MVYCLDFDVVPQGSTQHKEIQMDFEDLDNIEVLEIASHRNGVAGEPFWAIVFNWTTYYGTTEKMVGIVHEQPGFCSVLNMDKLPSVAFGVNSWRGDHFERSLRRAIKKYMKLIPKVL